MLRGGQEGIRQVASGSNDALIRRTKPPRTTKTQLMWTVAVTIMATLVVVVLVINFHTPEKKIQKSVGTAAAKWRGDS
jgi:hypothetical protein